MLRCYEVSKIIKSKSKIPKIIKTCEISNKIIKTRHEIVNPLLRQKCPSYQCGLFRDKNQYYEDLRLKEK